MKARAPPHAVGQAPEGQAGGIGDVGAGCRNHQHLVGQSLEIGPEVNRALEREDARAVGVVAPAQDGGRVLEARQVVEAPHEEVEPLVDLEAGLEERGRLVACLEELPVHVWPSGANFVLFRPERADGSEVWRQLVERSVLVRDCSSWPRLEGCLRVTVGTRTEDDAFLAALEEILT